MNQNISLREIEEKFKELEYYLRSNISSRIKLSILHSFLRVIHEQSSHRRFYSYFQEIQEQVPELLQPDVLKFRSHKFLDQIKLYLQMMEDVGIEIVNHLITTESHKVQDETSGFSCDTVWIPLVEQEQTQGFGLIQIATIQPLTVQVEQRRSDAETDLIFFNNYPVNIGDSFYNQALDAVGAAKKQLKTRKIGNIPKFRVMFGFVDKEYFYTGESFGLGMSLAVLAQMEKVTIQRIQHQIVQSAVITGGIDVNGQVRGVSDQSLPTKVEAFYHSSFQTFVHPGINKSVTEKFIAELTRFSLSEQREESRSSTTIPKTPIQKLINSSTQKPSNIPTSDLTTVLKNETIIQRKTITLREWSQAHIRKNQVMRYVAALLLIGGIGWGSWWVTRDLNPVSYEIEAGVLKVYNIDSKLLWAKQVVPFSLAKAFHKKDRGWHVQIYDINGDGKNEILYIPNIDDPKYDGTLTCKDYMGKDLWKVDLNETMSFGDDLYPPPLSTSCLKVFADQNNHIEIVVSLLHYPMFPSKISRISTKGVEISTYYHGGHILDLEMLDINNDGKMDLLFCGINNENRDAIIGAIELNHLDGRSPQLKDNYTNKDSPDANHIFYLRFPKADWVDMGMITNTFKIFRIDRIDNGGFLAKVEDNKIGYEVIYAFSSGLKLQSATITDLMNYKYLNIHGHSLYEDYSQEYIKEKLYDIKSWDGDKWVDFANK